MDDFQIQAMGSDSEHLLLGGPDLPEKEFQSQDINDNENIEDLIDGILGEAGAPSFRDADANIISSTSQDIAKNHNVEAIVIASQDPLSLPKMSEVSEVAGKMARSSNKAQASTTVS